MTESTETTNAIEGAAERGNFKTRTGVVVSNKMDKTAVVAVERKVTHPLYGKVMRLTKKLHVHDERNQCNIGDKVRVIETRPMSRTKRWRLIEIVERAK